MNQAAAGVSTARGTSPLTTDRYFDAEVAQFFNLLPDEPQQFTAEAVEKIRHRHLPLKETHEEEVRELVTNVTEDGIRAQLGDVRRAFGLA